MKEEIIYFEKAGIENTDKTLKLAKKRALKRKIRHIVFASTRGYTAKNALAIFKQTNIHLVAIPHQCGSLEGGLFDEEIKKAFEAAGHDVYFSTMLFATHRFWKGALVPGTITDALYRFCQGMKVCVEITLMAANGGKIPIDENVIAIGGTDIGADTAIVIRSSTTFKFQNLQVREIICKPLYSIPVTRDVIEKRVQQMKELNENS